MSFQDNPLGSKEYLLYGLAIAFILIILSVFSRKKPKIFSHWYHLAEGLQFSTKEFYASLEAALKRRQVPDYFVYRKTFKEGGAISAKRIYLRVKRKEYSFDICAAPFGNGFFISWWLGESFGFVYQLPILGLLLLVLLRPSTYYRLDTALMFQQSIHNAVIEVLEQATQAKGLRSLSEVEKKPILSSFFKK